MQVLFLGKAPRTKETLPDFLKWRRVTRPPLVFCGLTGSQRTPGFWGVTEYDIQKFWFQEKITFDLKVIIRCYSSMAVLLYMDIMVFSKSR